MQGWAAQSTSVPGVAQRTGATIYYIETVPTKDGVAPVFALMPTPGDVDVVMAAELMEAGRSVLRGLVTPERTTLIASTHRAFAVAEKQAPGDGVGDPAVVSLATEFAAKRLIAFDMEALAKAKGSMISATMFGALAAAGALAFPAPRSRPPSARGGRASRGVCAPSTPPSSRPRRSRSSRSAAIPRSASSLGPTRRGTMSSIEFGARIRGFPAPAQPMLCAGARKLVDYLDPTYALEYLDQVGMLCDLDRAHRGEAKGWSFTIAAAKYVAAAMAYDDVPRVADLKIRASRQARVRQEVGAGADVLVSTTEYFQPRVEELCGSLPKDWGEWIEARPRLVAALRKFVDRGRRIRPNTVTGYLTLAFVASLGPRRRNSLRHTREATQRGAWLKVACEALAARYELGVEALACRRLVKGYSDTHVRGLSKFERVMSAVPTLAAREDGLEWLRRLKQAALADEMGAALDGVLKTIATL